MARVIADISMSLDGFVTGPDPGPGQGLGRGGEALHTWAISSTDPLDAEILREGTHHSGAVVMGRRLFDFVDGPEGWDEQMGYGAREAGSPRFFVVTHEAPKHRRLAALDFTFVTDGLAAAVGAARDAAGEKHAVIMGGATVVRDALTQGLVDQLVIHLAPVILGSGTPLFATGAPLSLVQESVRASSAATHLTYRVTTA